MTIGATQDSRRNVARLAKTISNVIEVAYYQSWETAQLDQELAADRWAQLLDGVAISAEELGAAISQELDALGR